jgi:hypothetical protein
MFAIEPVKAEYLIVDHETRDYLPALALDDLEILQMQTPDGNGLVCLPVPVSEFGAQIRLHYKRSDVIDALKQHIDSVSSEDSYHLNPKG